ncbi:hypothetical protein UFOVP26_137 [uncultured Caudovirales phage]|uniref:Uncharacterized protein n=1 Tax=uncultured Caudovirales phage TaxID=2100421 RepID=A0A6J5KKL9_9CAUD|nr:hypothetical protein UFOVP26_137 [uncultured Caudovirales phage]
MIKKSKAQRESERRARKAASEAKARERAAAKVKRESERRARKAASEAKARERAAKANAKRIAANAKKNHHIVNHRTDAEKAITGAKRKSNKASGKTT